MQPIGVVEDQPSIEVSLERSDALIVGGVQSLSEELLLHGAGEALDEAVHLQCPHTDALCSMA